MSLEDKIKACEEAIAQHEEAARRLRERGLPADEARAAKEDEVAVQWCTLRLLYKKQLQQGSPS